MPTKIRNLKNQNLWGEAVRQTTELSRGTGTGLIPRIPPHKDQVLGEVNGDCLRVWWAQEVCLGPRKDPEGQRIGPTKGEGGHWVLVSTVSLKCCVAVDTCLPFLSFTSLPEKWE